MSAEDDAVAEFKRLKAEAEATIRSGPGHGEASDIYMGAIIMGSLVAKDPRMLQLAMYIVAGCMRRTAFLNQSEAIYLEKAENVDKVIGLLCNELTDYVAKMSRAGGFDVDEMVARIKGEQSA